MCIRDSRTGVSCLRARVSWSPIRRPNTCTYQYSLCDLSCLAHRHILRIHLLATSSRLVHSHGRNPLSRFVSSSRVTFLPMVYDGVESLKFFILKLKTLQEFFYRRVSKMKKSFSDLCFHGMPFPASCITWHQNRNWKLVLRNPFILSLSKEEKDTR